MTIGVNLSGAEYSWMPFPSAPDFDYLASEGVTLVRLPISWERMQPTLNGPLDQTYLAGLENTLNEAAAHGIKVVIDLHNYGHYNVNYFQEAAANYGIVSSTDPSAAAIGSAQVPISAYANFWSQLATQLNGHAGIAGYDIMNEPSNMPNASIWPQAAQAAVDAIRAVDMNMPIYVEGDHYSNAINWLQYNANLHVTDPANKIIYEAHAYFDDGSGQYAQTYDQEGATPNTGVQDVQPFLNWLSANNYQGFLGEFGVPSNDPRWIPVLNNVISALQSAGVSGAYWNYVYADPSGANSWWPVADSMSIDPSRGWGSAQMETIFAHSSPAITGFSPDTGTVGDGTTSANHVTLTGTAAENSTVQVYDGTNLLGTTIAGANGTWSFATGTLSGATHTFTATQTDTAGTVSMLSTTLNVTVDTVAPGAPGAMAFSPDSNVAGDGVTNANHLTLTGTAVANSTVLVFDGATQIGSVTAAANGSWSFATGTLADGAHAFTSKDMDQASNVSAASATLNVTVDTVAPGAPGAMAFSPDSNVAGDGVTNANHVTLTGTAVANSTVLVFDGATQIGTATAAANGAWSFATGALTDGAHAFTSKDMDVAGNVSAASATLTVTVDTVAPGAPGTMAFSPDSNVAGDGVTNANHVTLTGTAVANSTVLVFDGATQIGTATAAANGAWSFATGALTDGAHAFTSKDMDAAGNVSAASATLTVTVDTVAPGAPGTMAFSPDSNVAGDGVTNANHVTLTGTAVANSTVLVFDGATQIGTATAAANGAWSFATGALTDGTHAFTSKDMDLAGNVSAASATLNVTVDTAAPGAPGTMAFSPDSNVAGDGITNANHVTLTGTAVASSTVLVFDGATQIGSVIAAANGIWSVATGALADGTHAFTSKDMDLAGNVSAASATLNVTVDTVAPGAPIIANDAVHGTHVTLTGTAEANSKVQILDGAVMLGNVTANGSGAWSFSSAKLANGAHAFTATATDAAGNTSALSQVLDPVVGTAMAADFNGDQLSDLFFRQQSTQAFAGSGFGEWQSTGSSFTPNTYNGNVGDGWTLSGMGDFNGDGQTDVLWQNGSTFTEWQSNASGFTPNVFVGSVGPGWTLAAVGDFSGDGQADLLWQNGSTFTEWNSNGNGFTPNAVVASVGPGWSLAGVGDFNGDGKTDLLWQNGGTFTEWQSNGSGFTPNVFVGSVAPGWTLAAAGDFSGDGQADLLWQNGGTFTEWQSNGNGFTPNTVVGAVAAGWKVANVGDYNGDAKNDLIWMNGSTFTEWQSTGSGFTPNTFVGSVGQGWGIAGNPTTHTHS